jgi:hypothetical protein
MTEPTFQDAQLMIQIAQYWASAGIQKSLTWLWSDKYLPNYDEFVAKYPVGSKQFGRANAVCGAMEMLGTLYKHGLFNGELLFDWLAVDLIWDRVGGFALGVRKAAGDERLYENFEALAKAQSG